MRRLIFPIPTSILAFVSLRNGHPSMSGIPRSPSISRTMKSASMKVFLTFTKRFSTTPSGYLMVESASCTHIVVGESDGYLSFLNVTLGIMLTLAPRSHIAWSKLQSKIEQLITGVLGSSRIVAASSPHALFLGACELLCVAGEGCFARRFLPHSIDDVDTL